jgi:hypothetical protein
MAFKRALMVGIDEYQRMPRLAGCVNDVRALQPLLKTNSDGSPNFACETHVVPDGYVGRRQLLESLEKLLRPGADVALFYFAGHGASERNDVVLVAQDGASPDLGVAMSQVLGAVQESKVPEVILMLDCCFSGNAGQLPQIGSNVATIRDGVSILTASRGDQTAAESTGRGFFSSGLCAALEGGAADVLGEVDIASIFAYISKSAGAFDQRPTLKANVDRLHTLRRCASAVPLEELRQLPVLFETAETVRPLDPTYEPTHPARVDTNVKLFGILQRCRSAGLVVAVGIEHLYDAAMQSKGCRLTPLGRRYWAMAKKGELF